MTTTKGQPSLLRITMALLSCGMSLPFFGWRKPVGKSKTLRTA